MNVKLVGAAAAIFCAIWMGDRFPVRGDDRSGDDYRGQTTAAGGVPQAPRAQPTTRTIVRFNNQTSNRSISLWAVQPASGQHIRPLVHRQIKAFRLAPGQRTVIAYDNHDNRVAIRPNTFMIEDTPLEVIVSDDPQGGFRLDAVALGGREE
jgi:hypothetical protein